MRAALAIAGGWFMWLAACAPRPVAIGNSSPPSHGLVVDAAAIHGVLALAPPRLGDREDAEVWLPRDPEGGVLAPQADRPGSAMLAVPVRGDAQAVRVAEQRTLPYGCDGGELTFWHAPVVAGLAAGPVLLLNTPLPAGWAPTPIALVDDESTAAVRRAHAGPLEVDVVRLDAEHARVEVRRDGHVVSRRVAEARGIEGASPIDIDLTEDYVGIPRAVAAWSLAPDGPVLLTFMTRGYEGVTLNTVLVNDRAVDVPALGMYLYQCAF